MIIEKMANWSLSLFRSRSRTKKSRRQWVLAPYHSQSSKVKTISYGIFGKFSVALFGIVNGFYFAVLPLDLSIFLVIPILIMAFLTIWMLPDRDIPANKSIPFLFFALLLSMVLWPNYLAIAFPGLPWISMRRLFMAPLALIFLISLSTSKKTRQDVVESISAIPWLWKIAAALWAYETLTISMSNNILFSTKLMMISLIFSIFPLLIGCYVFLIKGSIEKFSNLMIISAIITSILGVIEFYQQSVYWVKYIPSFLVIDNENIGYILGGNRRAYGSYRPISTFDLPLTFGEYLAMATPFAIHRMMNSISLIKQLVYFVCSAMILAGCYYSGARLALVGTIIAYAVYGLLWGIHRWRTRKADLIGPAVVIAYPALMMLVFAAVVSIGRLRSAVLGNGSTDASTAARDIQWALAIPKIIANPFGYGPGSSGGVIGFVLPSGMLSVDSYFLTMLTQYGIIGFLLFFGMIALIIYTCAQIAITDWKGEVGFALPVASALSAFFVIKYVFSQELNHPIIFMLIGMACALALRAKRDAADRTGSGHLAQSNL